MGMIVLFTSYSGTKPSGVEFCPGPIHTPSNKNFMTAYGAMATRANYTVEEAVELRYEIAREELESCQSAQGRNDLQEEVSRFGDPPGVKGSEERKEYFKRWLREKQEGGDGSAYPEGRLGQLQNIMNAFGEKTGQQGNTPVRAAALPALKAAVLENEKLQWDNRLESIAGELGSKIKDDPSDGTSQVFFKDPGFTCWLPTSTLTDEEAT